MDDSRIKHFTTTLLIVSGIILVFFVISIAVDGYNIFGSTKIDFAVTGQVGDFIGGLLGTIINAAAFYFLFLTLNEQRKENSKQSSNNQKENFERKFYELLALHRSNVSEMHYPKGNELGKSRTVIKNLVEEFIECYHETIRFTKMYPEMHETGLNPRYLEKLTKIKADNMIRTSITDLALIGLDYTIFYYGVSEGSDTTLLHVFNKKYQHNHINKLKHFFKLKPILQNSDGFQRWERFIKQNVEHMKLEFEAIYENRRNPVINPANPQTADNLLSASYYVGHQERLGHYFRHLYQAFKYISIQNILTDDEKYFYAKTFRAQLSTHEQLLIFFNSISFLGWKWEYLAERERGFPEISVEQLKLITKYSLIKNVPGTSIYQLKYRHYYPNIQYEFNEY